MKTFGSLLIGILLVWFGLLADAPPFALTITIQPGPVLELSLPTETGFQYRVESSDLALQPNWQVISNNIVGSGATFKMQQQPATATGVGRFYRAVRIAPTATISANAIAPIDGLIYPQGTIIGSALLGLQFTIPSRWKGTVRSGTSEMLFASDTEPGLVVGFISLTGDAQFVNSLIGQSFATSSFGGYSLTQAPAVTGNKIVAEWQGYGNEAPALLRLRAVVHSSGGVVAFGGLFTEPNRAVMDRVLNDLVTSTVIVSRPTRTDLVNLVSSKSFIWVKSTSVGSGGSYGSLSSWSQKNAFFCPGTYEITSYSESSYSGNLSGGAFYSGGSNGNSTEAGDWTIIDTMSGPVMVMVSSSGFEAARFSVSGNSMFFGEQQFDYSGPHNCH